MKLQIIITIIWSWKLFVKLTLYDARAISIYPGAREWAHSMVWHANQPCASQSMTMNINRLASRCVLLPCCPGGGRARTRCKHIKNSSCMLFAASLAIFNSRRTAQTHQIYTYIVKTIETWKRQRVYYSFFLLQSKSLKTCVLNNMYIYINTLEETQTTWHGARGRHTNNLYYNFSQSCI